AGLGHSGIADVATDVEMLVVGPGWPEHLQRRGPNHLAVPRHRGKLGGIKVGELVVCGRRTLEHRERTQVHRHIRVLGEEEPGIKGRHALHVIPSRPVSCGLVYLCQIAWAIWGSAQRTASPPRAVRMRPGADRLPELGVPPV